MSSKQEMAFEGMARVAGRVEAGSRLKIEFKEDLRKVDARVLSLFLSHCSPEGGMAVIERGRRPALDQAVKTGRIEGNRTFFVRFAMQPERYGFMHTLISSGAVNRISKA